MKLHPYILPGLNGVNDPEALKVQELVCRNLGIDAALLQLRTRKRYIVEARSLVFYILRHANPEKWSLSKLGNLYGLDHATVYWGIQNVKNWYKTNNDFRFRVSRFLEIK